MRITSLYEYSGSLLGRQFALNMMRMEPPRRCPKRSMMRSVLAVLAGSISAAILMRLF